MEVTNTKSRREILAATGGIALGTLLPRAGFAGIHTGVDDTIQVALVGCGGRGSGAAANALSVKRGPVRLVAMADVFQDRLQSSHEFLSGEHAAKMDVPAERRFVGFDGYRHAMDALRPGDIVILTTPPAFRCIHFDYAVQKGLNVFMEKPLTVDGPTSRRMLELAAKSEERGLKVGVGLMSRHTVGLQELAKRIEDGELGEILYMRGYRMHGPAAASQSVARSPEMGEVEFQIRRFHSFLWASGGLFADFYIHHIDHLCWMKGELPVHAQGLGGRHYRADREGNAFVDQNFDSYSVEYTFADGTKFFFDGRCMEGTHNVYSSFVHGTKGLAVAAKWGDFGGPQSIHSGQSPDPATVVWQSTDTSNPYQNEWEALVEAVRDGKPHNEVVRSVHTCVVTNMGRQSAHTGQLVTFEDALGSGHEFAPGLATMDYDGPAPVLPGPDGQYPQPAPGRIVEKEY
jgi:hypothetical protein